MAFTKKEWVDRNVEHPSRRKLTAVEGETDVYDVVRNEGTITNPGDAFNADTMNDLEGRIDDGFTSIKNISTGTLSTGETSITISDTEITTDSVLSFYTSIYGVSPTAATVETGSVTLTFDAQESDMVVGVKVDGTYTG